MRQPVSGRSSELHSSDFMMISTASVWEWPNGRHLKKVGPSQQRRLRICVYTRLQEAPRHQTKSLCRFRRVSMKPMEPARWTPPRAFRAQETAVEEGFPNPCGGACWCSQLQTLQTTPFAALATLWGDSSAFHASRFLAALFVPLSPTWTCIPI